MLSVSTFFTASEIQYDKKLPVLMSPLLGENIRLALGSDCPKDPKDKSFVDIAEMLKMHSEPKPLVISERLNFHWRDRLPEEIAAVYFAKLCCLATKCYFGGYLEEALQDQLVFES